MSRLRFLSLVVALLAGIGALAAEAEAEDRLRLELGSDRLWCTAGTVVLATWDVSGGEPPYAVTVQGEEMPADSYSPVRSTRVPCDALPPAAAEPLASGEMVIRAEVVDSAGTRASARARVLLAPQLPAPTGLSIMPSYRSVYAEFDPVAGAGALAEERARCARCAPYLLRYRALGAAEWRYERAYSGRVWIDFEPAAGGVGEMQAAALRRSLEAEHPEALNWSEPVRYGIRYGKPLIAVTGRSDRVEVRVRAEDVEAQLSIELRGATDSITRVSESGERLVTHYATFDGLRPNRPYSLRLPGLAEEPFDVRILTAPGPPPPSRPKLEISSPTGSCTAGTETAIDWHATGGNGPYEVEIAGVPDAGWRGTVRVECGPLPRDGNGGVFGSGQRVVRGSATDRDGAISTASAALLTVPPLPPPRFNLPQAQLPGFDIEPDLPVASGLVQTWRLAMRWGAAGSPDWEYKTDELTTSWETDGTLTVAPRNNVRELTPGRDNTPVIGPSSDYRWPEATRFEVQLALLRDMREIERPHALRWSESAYVTTAAWPIGLEAVSTHDSISLSWGPAVEHLEFAAWLNPGAQEERIRLTKSGEAVGRVNYTVSPGPQYRIVWRGLCPATPYYASVRPMPSDYGRPSLSLLMTTEPEPGRTDRAPFAEATATADTITLQWLPDACVPHPTYQLTYRLVYRLSVAEYGGGVIKEAGLFHRDDQTHEISGLAPGSTYEVTFHPSDLNLHHSGPEGSRFTIIVETPERDSDPQSAAPPPVRYEFRARGIDSEGRPTRWPEPISAPPPPFTPLIRSMQYEREHLIVNWDAPDDGVPVDHYIIEWRTDDGDWERVTVGSGDGGAIPSAPFMDGSESYLRVRAVNDEYGAGEPSPEQKIPSPRRDVTTAMDARECTEDQSGTFRFAWILSGGIAPFTIRLRPIRLAPDAADVVKIVTSDWRGRAWLRCADVAEEHEGELHASVVVQISEYGHQPPAEQIQRIPFGSVDELYRSYYEFWLTAEYEYEALPSPLLVDKAVHATHIVWQIGLAGCGIWRSDRMVVRMRSAADEDWIERELRTGGPDRCYPAWIGELQPATRYEYVFGRYSARGVEWSEPGVVTTLGPVTGIAVSERGDAVVEWDAQPDAWRYAVRLRGAGRSWWRLHEAAGGERERVSFAGAAGHGPYEAEIITPPKDSVGDDTSKFDWWASD